MKKNIFWTFFVLILIFIGCSTKQTIIETSNLTKIDSTYFYKKELEKFKSEKVITVQPATKQKLNINSICDSLGTAKNVDLSLNNGKTKVKIINNTLYIEANTDSIVSVIEKEYRDRFKQDSIALVNSSTSDKKRAETKIIYKTTKYTYYFFFWGLIATAILFSRFKTIFPDLF